LLLPAPQHGTNTGTPRRSKLIFYDSMNESLSRDERHDGENHGSFFTLKITI
jgi:hypothetical protein